MSIQQDFDATMRKVYETVAADTAPLIEAVRDLAASPRTMEDLRMARRIAATGVQEAAARVRVEHGRVVDIYDIAEAVNAYIEGERAGWPGQRRPER